MPSSVQLIAGAGILGNVGGVSIEANSNVISTIGSYYTIPAISQYSNVVVSGNVVLANTIIASLLTLGNTTFPAVTDVTPSAYSSNIGNLSLSGFVGAVTSQISNIMGNGDLGKFDQILSAASGYCQQVNGLINSAINANTDSDNQTFQSQDSVITGGLSQITQAFNLFGEDLTRLGLLINLDNLPKSWKPASTVKPVNYIKCVTA